MFLGNCSSLLLCLTVNTPVMELVWSQFQKKAGCMSSDLQWDEGCCETLHCRSLESCISWGFWGDTVESLGLETKEWLWCSHGISQKMRN